MDNLKVVWSVKSVCGPVRKKNEDDYEYNTRKKIEEIELNKILEKISNSGYKSLSKKEKKILKKYSQN